MRPSAVSPAQKASVLGVKVAAAAPEPLSFSSPPPRARQDLGRTEGWALRPALKCGPQVALRHMGSQRPSPSGDKRRGANWISASKASRSRRTEEHLQHLRQNHIEHVCNREMARLRERCSWYWKCVTSIVCSMSEKNSNKYSIKGIRNIGKPYSDVRLRSVLEVHHPAVPRSKENKGTKNEI